MSELNASQGSPSHPGAAPVTGWKRIKLIIKVIEVRLRFIAILVATWLIIGYWDTIANYWDKWTRASAATVSTVPAGKEFFCPMHPNVVRPGLEPNGEVPKCPICGMPLALHTKGGAAALPDGVVARVQLSPERIRLAGIQTVEVTYQPLSKQITTVGNVTYDESRLSRVVSRVGGYVEKLYIDKTFVTVEQGDRLAEIYSPELYSAAQELVLAAKRGGELVASSRQRLELLGVNSADIDDIVNSGKATARLVLRSPQAGHVIDKKIVDGARVEAGMTLLEIADLSRIWIEADVYEKDIAFLRPGQTVEATLEALPGRTFNGRVSVVHPHLEVATRTNLVRFELDNPKHEIRPGMYATVKIDVPLEEIEPFKSLIARQNESSDAENDEQAQTSDSKQPGYLAVPERSVVDTGSRQVVYVESKPGVFDAVEVELGPRSGGLYPVIKGLEAGDRVAAAGAFLIDAETRLNPAAAGAYVGASGGPKTNDAMATASTQTKTAAKPKLKKPSADDLKNIAKLPVADRPLALAQGNCPITNLPLGSMGMPIKINLKNEPVFLCCKGCLGKAQKNPDDTLKKVAAFKQASKSAQGKK